MTFRATVTLLAAALALPGASGCSGDDDAKRDTGVDSGLDGGTDRDAGVDSGLDGDGGESFDGGGDPDAGTPASSLDHVYVTAGGADELVVYELRLRTRELTEVQRLSTGPSPGAIAAAPDGSALYVAIRGGDAVQAFGRDATSGRLTGRGTTSVGANPVYLTVDATGDHLLWASYGADRIQSHLLAADGTVESAFTSGFDTRTNPHAIPLDPTNRWAIVPNTNSDVVQVYGFDQGAGSLTEADPFETSVPGGTGPRHLDFHPTLDLLYVVNEHADSVTGYRFDPATGALAEPLSVSTLPATGADADANTCADIHVHPGGGWLYASNRGHDSIAIVALDASGGMTLQETVPTEAHPREMDITPDGEHLVVAGRDSGNLAVYAIDPADGSLGPSETTAVGPSPMWVEILDAD